MLDKVQKEIASNIVNMTTKTLQTSSNDVALLSKLNGKENNILEHQDILIDIMLEQLRIYSYLNSIYLANNEGVFIQVRRYPSLIVRVIKKEDKRFVDTWYTKNSDLETIDIKTTDSDYTPNSRIWYEIAHDSEHTFWSEPYLYATSHELGITVSRAIFDENGTKTKVAGADITYQRFNQFLSTQAKKIGGNILIFDTKQNIIASSFKKHQANTKEIPKLNSSNSGIFSQSYQNYLQGKKSGIVEDENGQKYIYFFYPFPKDSSQKWEILTLIPQKIILGDILLTIYQTIAISLVILILFIFIVMYLSKKISRPIRTITQQIKSIETLQLDIEISEDSQITEIRAVQHSLNSLKIALSSFIKYIPVDLVKRLIELNQEAKIGGREKDLAIMFTDIENFTTISEAMHPSDVATELSEYFDVINRVIKQKYGTIDKYIGDGVLAFWGAPKEVENPILLAVQSLIEIEKEIKKFNIHREKENKAPFKTRIAVHYGKTLVGNIGSKDRLNYTIIGDSVNITARLEAINKQYGTYNIISDEVYAHIKGMYKTQYLDSISLKGKTKVTKFYTIILE